MKKDEKLTKETGQPVFKGVMDYDDLDTAPGQEGDEKTHEDEPKGDYAARALSPDWMKKKPPENG